MDREWLTLGWKILVVRGALAVVFGILAIVWPLETAIALALLWGFWALVEGVGALVQAFQQRSGGNRWWLAGLGVVSLVVAFFAIFHPSTTAVALTWILGIWLIVRGLFELFAAFRSDLLTPRWLLVLSAVLSIVLGILFTANPGAAVVGIAVLLGVMALIWGAVFIAIGLVVRRALNNSGGTEAGPAVASA
ncbi:uncharacterized membrane protein HdeD (DUF308 family) [Kribbella amoyensis]|uniref:Uncharacterized membrane protein HdeD (DUF308 family) n=1 Tax=Kribbella amoyensis TaxID=996641 RepID=A0A561BUD8_9ACTN|nr:HdeD family acid-resistance protein [Kribbella amoyensis]TWD82477.1 uncharacterized membrane protein HdeD (DUF308 family) [Kribbella amoyensis]